MAQADIERGIAVIATVVVDTGIAIAVGIVIEMEVAVVDIVIEIGIVDGIAIETVIEKENVSATETETVSANATVTAAREIPLFSTRIRKEIVRPPAISTWGISVPTQLERIFTSFSGNTASWRPWI